MPHVQLMTVIPSRPTLRSLIASVVLVLALLAVLV